MPSFLDLNRRLLYLVQGAIGGPNNAGITLAGAVLVASALALGSSCSSATAPSASDFSVYISGCAPLAIGNRVTVSVEYSDVIKPLSVIWSVNGSIDTTDSQKLVNESVTKSQGSTYRALLSFVPTGPSELVTISGTESTKPPITSDSTVVDPGALCEVG